jgi:hypothetical protein
VVVSEGKSAVSEEESTFVFPCYVPASCYLVRLGTNRQIFTIQATCI